MYKCSKCNKIFTHASQLKIHKERKTPCVKNTTSNEVISNNINIDNNLIQNLEDNLQVSQPSRTSVNPNVDLLKDEKLISAYQRRARQIKHYRMSNDPSCMLSVLKTLELLNFNMSYQENNKFLVFLKLDDNPRKFMYLILEFDINNNKYIRKEISYENFLIDLLELMNKVCERLNSEDFNIIMNNLNEFFKNDKNLKNDKDFQNYMKEQVEDALYVMSNR